MDDWAFFCFIISAKKSRYWSTGSNALDVETAGYALLTQVILGRTGYAGPIVTYLTNQRKGGVGFVSTQVCKQYLETMLSSSKCKFAVFPIKKYRKLSSPEIKKKLANFSMLTFMYFYPKLPREQLYNTSGRVTKLSFMLQML